MPLLRSAARHANRTNEAPALLVWNGGAEDKASGDHLAAEMSDMHCSTVPYGNVLLSLSLNHRLQHGRMGD